LRLSDALHLPHERLALSRGGGLSVGFSWYGWRLLRNFSDALARKTFRFSLIQLLFGALLVDHYLV
jgi:heme O synthase-like polyprenyltransferase